jgi:hypothetical protein
MSRRTLWLVDALACVVSACLLLTACHGANESTSVSRGRPGLLPGSGQVADAQSMINYLVSSGWKQLDAAQARQQVPYSFVLPETSLTNDTNLTIVLDSANAPGHNDLDLIYSEPGGMYIRVAYTPDGNVDCTCGSDSEKSQYLQSFAQSTNSQGSRYYMTTVGPLQALAAPPDQTIGAEVPGGDPGLLAWFQSGTYVQVMGWYYTVSDLMPTAQAVAGTSASQ